MSCIGKETIDNGYEFEMFKICKSIAIGQIKCYLPELKETNFVNLIHHVLHYNIVCAIIYLLCIVLKTNYKYYF